MRTFEEIAKIGRCHWIDSSDDGMRGIIALHGWQGTIIVSNGAGWEHVSVSPMKKHYVPTWDDMCAIKRMFWNDNEAVIQIHPAQTDYVNNMPNCLHLWRCSYKDMVLPPSCLVGLRKGQTVGELAVELEEAYRIAGEEF